MQYSKVPFTEIKQEILRIFDCKSYNEEWSLSPDDIYNVAFSCGIKLEWVKIPKWDNDYNFSDEEFLEIAFIKDFGHEIIYLVTDECFQDKQAFSVSYNDLLSFIQDFYTVEFKMEFPQPSDFVFIVPSRNLISMIHHEGQGTKYRTKSSAINLS